MNNFLKRFSSKLSSTTLKRSCRQVKYNISFYSTIRNYSNSLRMDHSSQKKDDINWKEIDERELNTEGYVSKQMKHMNIQKVGTFSSIRVERNSLIVCDIDETVLKFPDINKKWWSLKFDHYYAQHKDYDRASSDCLTEWLEYISRHPPQLTDPSHFNHFLHRVDEEKATLIFLTAREESLRDLTIHHFQSVNIPANKYTIFHIGDQLKGDFIRNSVEFNKYPHKLFIDDYLFNIESVYEHFKNEFSYYLYDFSS